MKCVTKGNVYNAFRVEDTKRFYEKMKFLKIEVEFKEKFVEFNNRGEIINVEYGDYIIVYSKGFLKKCSASEFVARYMVIDEYDGDTKEMCRNLSTIIDKNNRLITFLNEFSEKGNRFGVNELMETVKIQFSENLKLIEERMQKKEPEEAETKVSVDKVIKDLVKMCGEFTDFLQERFDGNVKN